MTITFAVALFGAMIVTFAAGMALGISLTFGRPWRQRAIAVEIVSNGRETRVPRDAERAASPDVRTLSFTGAAHRSEQPAAASQEGRGRVSNIAYRGMCRMALATRLARGEHSKNAATVSR